MATSIHNPIINELAMLSTLPSRMTPYGTLPPQIQDFNDMVASASSGMNSELSIARIKYPMMAAYERQVKTANSINTSVPSNDGGPTFNNAMTVYMNMKGLLINIYNEFDAAIIEFEEEYPMWNPLLDPPFNPSPITATSQSAINSLVATARNAYAAAMEFIQQTAFNQFAVSPLSEAIKESMAPITSTPSMDKVVQDMQGIAGARITSATLTPKRNAMSGDSLEANTIYPDTPKAGVSPAALTAFQNVALLQRTALDAALKAAQDQAQVCLNWKVANNYDEIREYAEANPDDPVAQEQYEQLKLEFNTAALNDYNDLQSVWSTLNKAYTDLLNTFYDEQV